MWNLIICQKLNCSMHCIRSTGLYCVAPTIHMQLNVHSYQMQTVHQYPNRSKRIVFPFITTRSKIKEEPLCGSWVFGLCPSSGLRLALSKGPNRVGVFPHLRTETIQFPKRCVFHCYLGKKSGRWTKSEKPISLCVIHHRQNPIVSTMRLFHNALQHSSGSRYSSVGIVITAGRPMFNSRRRQEIILFSTTLRPALRHTQLPIQWVPGRFPPE
jgi:hypothetical protein